MDDIIQPNSWVALKLPSETVRILQIAPNTTISLGKYGSFPSNLIINRPYHITWELLAKREGESFCRLRVVPAAELYADLYSETASNATNTPAPDADAVEPQDALLLPAVPESEAETESSADKEIRAAAAAVESSAKAMMRNNNDDDDDPSRQTLSMREIEVLKKDGARAGKDLINKLIDSHTAIDQKTAFSLAKYRLLKTKKYIRRFSVMPFDVARMDNWLLEDKDPTKVLEMREEMIALVGCWGNVHYGGDVPDDYRPVVLDPETGKPAVGEGQDEEEEQGAACGEEMEGEEEDGDAQLCEKQPLTGRWLVVDDTGGLLTAAMAERMGLLYETKENGSSPSRLLNAFGQRAREHGGEPTVATAESTSKLVPTKTTISPKPKQQEAGKSEDTSSKMDIDDTSNAPATTKPPQLPSSVRQRKQYQQHRSDFEVQLAPTNTLTVIHQNGQPNLSFLKYWDFDVTSPNPHRSTHPLASHLLSLTWLQLIEPSADVTYASSPPDIDSETLAGWKASRRGNYHRKRRRWARTRYIVDSTREGGFSGLVVASSMDPVSVMQGTLHLLAGGAPVAVYSQSIEPLMALADCFSLARRSAWASSLPKEAEGLTTKELEKWRSADFPLNPSLLLGVAVQTSRVRRWQVHPGRTHPLMTSRGGAEGYVLTGYRAVPAEGRVEARGKFKRRKVGPV